MTVAAQLLSYVLMFASIGLAVVGLAGVIPAADDPAAASALRRGNSEFERMLARIGTPLLPRSEEERRALDLLLLQSGYDSPQAAAVYFGIRLGCGAALLMVSTVLMVLSGTPLSRVIVPAGMSGVVGMLLPPLILKLRRKQHQADVRDALPDMLDLMLVCSDAGLGLEMAIARVGEELRSTRPRLAAHLDQIGRELLAGRSKLDALRAFAERTGVPELISLARLLIQSDALGTSMASALRVFAEEMQAYRLLRAEELAQKVSAKMSMVLVGCFMPAIMIAIIAPIAFNIVHTWKGIHP